MTFLGKVMALFPGLHMLVVLSSLVGFVYAPGVLSFAMIPLAVYILPLVVFHLHNQVYPLEEGTFSIVQGYSPWFGTHMIQQNFISFKVAEEVLRTIPGLFLCGFELGDRRSVGMSISHPILRLLTGA